MDDGNKNGRMVIYKTLSLGDAVSHFLSGKFLIYASVRFGEHIGDFCSADVWRYYDAALWRYEM